MPTARWPWDSGEFMPTDDVALAVRKITREGSRRIAEEACRIAASRSRRLAVVHKANVLSLTDGLFRDTAFSVAGQHGGLEVEEYLVDAMAALLVREPDAFDVIVTTNMFGDILSDLTAELSGGLGLGPSINAGRERAIAQAAHGAAPDIAGRGVANPTAMILSVAMLLDWLGLKHGPGRFAAGGRQHGPCGRRPARRSGGPDGRSRRPPGDRGLRIRGRFADQRLTIGAGFPSIITLMQAGLPLARARANAAGSCPGRVTSSPCAPSASATKSYRVGSSSQPCTRFSP